MHAIRRFLTGYRYRDANAACSARRVESAGIIDFAERYGPQWFHVDADRAAAGRWNGLITSGWLTCGIAMELAVEAALVGSEYFGSPEIVELRWLEPVRPGDELRLRIEVLESRPSSSGRTGVVRRQWRLLNQADRPVVQMIAMSLFDVAQIEADCR